MKDQRYRERPIALSPTTPIKNKSVLNMLLHNHIRGIYPLQINNWITKERKYGGACWEQLKREENFEQEQKTADNLVTS
jgi:hypothetical protein